MSPSDGTAVRYPPPERDAQFATSAVLRAFPHSAAHPGQPIDGRHLTAYRHPSEGRGLLIAVVVVAVTVGIACGLSWAAGVALLGLLLLAGVITHLNAAQHLASAAEVTPTQFAHLYPTVAELRQRLAMPRTRVFVRQSPVINASASGFREPYIVVLNSALVDALDAQELTSVLGHEMGHIKFGHTRLALLLGGLDTRGVALPFPVNLVASLRDAVFLWWERSKEMSADRVGIIACGRLSKAISAQVKLSVGPTLYQHVQLEDLAQQAADLRTGVGRIEGFLSQLGASHPFLVNRIQAMIDFVGEPSLGETVVEPQAPPARRAVLIQRRGPEGARPHDLDGRPLLAGRSPSVDVQIRDRAVSRRHFEVRWEGEAYILEDLRSNNGTFVNGDRVRVARLRDGDLIRAGFVELEFHLVE